MIQKTFNKENITVFVGDKMSNSVKTNQVDHPIQQENEENLSYPSYLVEQLLLQAIKRGDQFLAEQLSSSISQHDDTNLAGDALRSRQNHLISTCTLFTKGILDGGVQPQKAYPLRDSYIHKIEQAQHLDELYYFERMMLEQFIECVQQETTSPYSKVINEAIHYIHDYILHDLTLDMIAEHCYVSPSYLSHLFKKEVGISVVQFINQKRIKESKYFLSQTSIPISDIATLFQFCNQSYFTSLFKKYTDQTPKEYRGV